MKCESLLGVFLGVVPNAVFVYSVLNQCSHYCNDRDSKKNLAPLPRELIIPFKYISFSVWLILESPVILQQNSKEKCTFCAEEKNPIYKTKYLKKCPNNYDPKCLGMAI